MKKLINTKDWGHSIYNAYLDIAGNYSRLQDKATGVAAVCIDENEKVVLMSGEPIGGHIEKGEAVDDALERKSLEEGGIKLEKWKFFGYYEVILKKNAEQKYKDKYPKNVLLVVSFSTHLFNAEFSGLAQTFCVNINTPRKKVTKVRHGIRCLRGCK